MNDDTCDEATDQPVPLNNKYTPDTTLFSGAVFTPTSGTAAGATAVAALGGGGGGIYCNQTTRMRISKNRSISTEIETRRFERGNGL